MQGTSIAVRTCERSPRKGLQCWKSRWWRNTALMRRKYSKICDESNRGSSLFGVVLGGVLVEEFATRN